MSTFDVGNESQLISNRKEFGKKKLKSLVRRFFFKML